MTDSPETVEGIRSRVVLGSLLGLAALGMLAIGLLIRNDELAFWTIMVGVACNIPCAILGTFLLLRRMSLLGDAISHAVLPGIAIGFLLTGELTGPGILLGAVAFGVLTAFLTQTLAWFGRVPEDASMGVVFTSLFAVGVILITNAAANVDLDPGCVLYGLIEFTPLDSVPIAGVEVPRVLGTLGLAGLLTLLFVTMLWKELKLASFDPALASAMGFPAGRIHYLLMAMVAVVTVAAFEAVGSILVVAMLIVPAAAAHLLTDNLVRMLVIAVLIGIASAFGGYAGAVVIDTSVAGMMAVVAGGIFAVAVVAAPRHGVVSKALHTLRLGLRIVSEDILAWLYRAEEAAVGNSVLVADQGIASGRPEVLRAVGGGLYGHAALLRLRLQGQIRHLPGQRVVLTERGRHAGNSLVRAHRLWETFLSTELQLPPDHLHEPAEWIEHFIGPTLQQELVAELDDPHADPHGRAIPTEEAGSSRPGR